MKKLKHLLAFLGLMAFGLLSNPLSAQISEGGLPPSFAFAGNNVLKSMKAPVVVKPNFDVKKQIELDDKKQEEAEGYLPYVVARMLPVNLNVDNSGEWKTLPDGTVIWTLQVNSPGAIAMYLSYEEFRIPVGGKLYIYNADRTQVLGAYTEKNNRNNKRFATEFVAGDQLILEYVAPPQFVAANGKIATAEKPKIRISDVAYGYNNLTVEQDNILKDGRPDHRTDPFYGRSGRCNVNINCSPEGDDWQIQKKGVARFLYPFIDGMVKTVSACTGTMINNTAQDLTPYFLTAAHCVENPTVFFDEMVFYFHYEVAGCDKEETSPIAKTLLGADLLVVCPSLGSSDGGLLKLYDDVPLDYGVYFNGWDRRNIPATSGVGIHHPAADVKKISTYKATPPVEATWVAASGSGFPNAHWRLSFDPTTNGWGITEPGSSGSPLFNQDGLVVGALTGGNTKCSNKDGRSFYGKLWYHWDQNPDPTRHMKDYLDPLNTGVETLPGTFIKQGVTEANFSVSNDTPYALTSVTYKDYSSGAESWEWTFDGGEPSSYVGKEPPAVKYSGLGSYTTKLVINKGTAKESVATKTISVVEKGDHPAAPTANFTFDKYGGSILLSEGFDDEPKATVPPTGWLLENHGTSTEQFIKGNFSGVNINFKDVADPNSVYSVVCKADPNNFVDSRLISPVIYLPENAYIEFWSLWDGRRVEGGVASVNISTDGGATFDEIWTNGPGNQWIEYGLGWHFSSIMLTEYAGKNVNLIFRFYGQGPDAYYGGFDGVKVATTSDPTQKITIGKGETITPTDLSVGPPTTYKWEFPGAETTSSDQQDPGAIRYMVPGVYDVILTVENIHGSDTRVFKNAVNVVLQQPEPSYDATSLGGYTLTTFGPFAPKVGRANLKDYSKKYPDAWEWTFEGATPLSSSTEKNPGWIEYNTPGEYALKLKASNAGGDSTIVVPGFAKIGYDLSGDIWNMLPGEDGMAGLTSEYGHLTGTNVNFGQAFAERFPAPIEAGFIESVDIMFHVNSATSGNLTVSIRPAVDGTGLPSKVASESLATVTLPVTSINKNGYTTVTFSDKVYIDQPFYVAVDGFRDKTTFDLYITTSEDRGRGGKNTGYVYYCVNIINLVWFPQDWAQIPDQYNGENVSLNIVPKFSYMYTDVDGETVYDRKNIDSRVGTVNIKSNTDWSVKSHASWIMVDAAPAYNGDGSFTFKVQDNVFDTRKGLIEISNPAGVLTKYIVVQQAGPAPVELTATIVDEATGQIELAWEEPEIVTSIFDDAERHIAWEINSAGPYGWTYIDGDGADTKAFGSGISYTNRGVPMAFQVFNMPGYPGAKYNPHFSRSGNQIFGCPSVAAASSATNDDWMISPMLSFKEDFTFSFWAKAYASTNSASVNYDEVFEVRYSISGNTVTDLATLVATEHVTDKLNWVQFEYTIPADAKHVAIRCISHKQHMLMLDDIFIGVGMAPQSMYVFDPTLNADPFAEIESAFKAESAPEQQQIESAAIITQLEGEQNATQSESAPIVKLAFGNGTPSGKAYANGGSTEADMEVALRFTPVELLAVHNSKIKAVDVYLKAAPVDGITINIRQHGNIIHSQKVDNPSIGKFIRVTLNKDVHIDASQDLYVGYAYTQYPNKAVAATDGGPGMKGKGDLVSENGESFQSITSLGESYNWLISILVENHHAIKDPSYTLYRDGAAIATTKELSYLDQIMVTEACYTVSAVYANDLESTVSNDACIELSAVPMPGDAPTLTATVEGSSNIALEWTAVTGAVEYVLYYSDGTEVTRTPGLIYTDSDLASGEYCYEVTAVNGAGIESDKSNAACAMIKYDLTVGVQNVSRSVGEANPDFVITYNGFATGDTEANLTVKPTATCTASALSPVGTYDIIVSGGESDKYNFVYNNGTLTIVAAPINSETNAFTPYEKDGINDVFMPGTTIEVVNRYGQSVFSGRDGWDGTRKNGQLVPPGSYFYKATLSDGRVLRGSVEVVKK